MKSVNILFVKLNNKHCMAIQLKTNRLALIFAQYCKHPVFIKTQQL